MFCRPPAKMNVRVPGPWVFADMWSNVNNTHWHDETDAPRSVAGLAWQSG